MISLLFLCAQGTKMSQNFQMSLNIDKFIKFKVFLLCQLIMKMMLYSFVDCMPSEPKFTNVAKYREIPQIYSFLSILANNWNFAIKKGTLLLISTVCSSLIFWNIIPNNY